ncbi:MAG: hypothetical protein VYD52_08820 [Pseudomonadota bacterium]|jgi:hypothetical protein|uniref:hypothetical protein n=1 Tax=unclassified Thalassolituus TaxID=2624967 RepID=UPI000C0DBAD7|nr:MULTISPECIES: hypothetical protein [unclassified Thalassolituus]MBN58415.1 hypothetical protein [Oceanospirillaceae bacterium]MDQ4424363.1 hypothetical protein [Thalassolituus sp.]MDQ4427101.1 hypothetical protein [Thalassolituus sp.]MEC9410542.1 hypothetical protein [Pseudomonadota bacterium]|tara:strand:+ start:1520 stop:1903 length:384 start_codon:yes stop_codon:yes gene_type:complete
MNTELTLVDVSGTHLSVDINQLTPMGFESVISQRELAELRDESGRFREFEMQLRASNDEQNTYLESLGVCRVHSVRRICADKSVLCLRFEASPCDVYKRLAGAGIGNINIHPMGEMCADIPEILRRA